MKRIAAFFLLLFLLPVAAFAGPLEDGQAAYNKGEYKKTTEILQPYVQQQQRGLNGWVFFANQGNYDQQEASFWLSVALGLKDKDGAKPISVGGLWGPWQVESTQGMTLADKTALAQKTSAKQAAPAGWPRGKRCFTTLVGSTEQTLCSRLLTPSSAPQSPAAAPRGPYTAK